MTVYYVTANKPGYLPEGEPIGCDTLDDARSVLASEISNTNDMVDHDSDFATAYNDAGEAMPGESIMFAGYAHTITESDEAF